MKPFPRTWIEVDLPALSGNLGILRETIGPEPKLGLVAKADAYGHGLVPVARAATQSGVSWLCVATVQEGIALRDSGIDCPILVLSPILPLEAEQAVFYNLRVHVEDTEVARAMSDAAERQGTTARVHLKVDTGISRFGALPQEVQPLASALHLLPSLELEGISTHFADSAADPERTERQMRKFEAVLKVCTDSGIHFRVVHIANSAGCLRYPAAHHHLVRVGIAAYGIDPYGFNIGLKPIMTWKARIMGTRTRPAGTWVSYSSTCQLKRETKLATLGVGYGDGYPRAMSNKGFVSHRGAICPVLGLVCMDQVIIDITDVGGEVGEEVELLGTQVTVPELASLAGTNSHEIVTRIMSRVPRRYKHS